MSKAKVRQLLRRARGRARGQWDSRGDSRASSSPAWCLQLYQKAGGCPALKLAVNKLEVPFVICTKRQPIGKGDGRAPVDICEL